MTSVANQIREVSLTRESTKNKEMPDKRQLAVEPLVVVQAFVNTIDIEDDRDSIADAASLADWLDQNNLLRDSAVIERIDFDRVIEIREAIRSLLVANGGGEIDPAAIATLNRATARAKLWAEFDEAGRSKLTPHAGGVDGAVGRILAIICEAMADGTWSRLKACHLDSCRWAFYDISKNRSGTWCSMAICGNRTKTRAYRQRHSARE